MQNPGNPDVLWPIARRIFFPPFDAGGGRDPDDGDAGNQTECQAWALEGERNRHDIDEEREPVLALDGLVLRFESVCMAEPAPDGETQHQEAESSEDHGRNIESDREGVHLLFEDVGGEEGQKREAEEEAEVGVEDEFVGLFGSVDEVVVVDPVNTGEGKGDEVQAKRGKDGAKSVEAILVGDLELEHHDGDDDGDDSVGEGFEPGWGGDVVGHVSGLGRSIHRRLWL